MPKEKVVPNETDKNFDDERRKSLDSFIKDKKFGKKESDDENDSEKNKKKLDNDQNNSYINNKDDDSDSDEQESKEKEGSDEESSDLEEYEKVLESTFGGDGKKAVKSWKESQKNYTKLRKQAKEYEQKLNYLEELVQKDPKVGKLIKTAAEKGQITDEDLQNFLSEGSREPNGKPNSTSDGSKLEIVDEKFDVSDINEETLVDAGYLNPERKEKLSPSDWKTLKRQAAVTYAEEVLPQKLAEKAYNKFQEQIGEAEQQKKEEARREENRELNENRYEEGVNRVIDEFNLDFAGNPEHEEMLEEIESLAANIRDPQNNNVIHPNAIYLATVEVMREKGLQPERSADVDEEAERARKDADESFDKRTGFNANTKPSGGDKKPETLAEKMAARHMESYAKEREKRIKTGRLHPDE